MRDSVRLSRSAVLGGAVLATLCFWHPIYGVSIAILPLVLWLGDRAMTAVPGSGASDDAGSSPAGSRR